MCKVLTLCYLHTRRVILIPVNTHQVTPLRNGVYAQAATQLFHSLIHPQGLAEFLTHAW